MQPAPEGSLSVRARISRHYALVLEKVFSNESNTHAILLEDDLRFSPDFLIYLTAALPKLQSAGQNEIVCASGWNDNGFASASASEAILTSFFPGLGWGLHRSLWELLRSKWPAYGTDIVGIGWDFWLRIYFERNGWTCITPLLSRVKHAGSSGSNVHAAQANDVYSETHTANVPIGEVSWQEVLKNVTVDKLKERTQSRLSHGSLVHSLEDVVRRGSEQFVMPYVREDYRSIASKLSLWPTPRGHFRYTLLAQIDTETDILLYDERWASRYFSVPESYAANVKFVKSEINESCVQACERKGATCSAEALEWANDCSTMLREFADCKGCAHETGADLPAMVSPSAPLETAGWCLITDSGMGDVGKLVCSDQFRWTRRLCGCVPENAAKDEL